MRVIVADAQSLFCQGLAQLLEAHPSEAIVTRAESFDELALALNDDPTSDLVLIGTPLPGLVSIHGVKPLREQFPLTRFAVMSSDDARDQMLLALGAGMHGFISKQQTDAQIVNAIRDILSGRIYIPQSIADLNSTTGAPSFRIAVEERNGADLPCVRLTKRQQDVLELIAEGCSNKEIARKLELSEATVKVHATAMMRSLGVRNRTEAALIARGR